jgi:hypothetical protein
MEEQPNSSQTNNGETKYGQPTQVNLPNATPVLVLGILSIVFCCWYFFSIIGVILGIIALAIASKDIALYRGNKSVYTLSSYNNLKAGRTCAIIGLVVSFVIFIIFMLVLAGLFATMPFWGMIE